MSPLILVVDPDRDTRQILRVAFEDRGHEVITAPDGHTGIELAERRPDVILGDFPLDVPGYSPFTEAARSAAGNGPLIVSFTARAMPDDLAEARRVSDAVFTKPAMPSEVVAAVERLLEET